MEELVKRLREHNGWALNETLDQAADAIEELSRENESLAKSVNEASEILRKRWIPVAERLPESQGPFLTRYGFGDASIETGQFFYGVLYYLYADAEPHWQHESVGVEVTHWMPLPEPPKEE